MTPVRPMDKGNARGVRCLACRFAGRTEGGFHYVIRFPMKAPLRPPMGVDIEFF
ncbi:MAG: hypothetical protein IIV80_05440 [Clostridia bacterium]|nr:hypothetical protein [Clostridia bacterium]